jgi:DNA-binding MarR family transcriptional regulator
MLSCGYMVTKVVEIIIQQADRYVRDILGITLVFLTWEKAKELPFYLRDHYGYFFTELLGVKCALMVDINEEERTPAIIGKLVQQVRKQGGMEVIYVREAVTSYNRKRLIEQRVPFIIPGNQMYLPTLGIDLREHLRSQREKRTTFSPSTQALLLYILHQKEINSLRPAQLAQILGYKKMTIGRSFRELEEAGIGEHNASARHRQLRFEVRGKALWDKVMPYLETPVRKRIYVPPGINIGNGILAGLSALARYTMLAEPRNPVYAIPYDEWKARKRRENLIEFPFEEPDSLEIELWNYSPALFCENEIADRLSLFLSLKDSKDERVQAAIEELMGGLTW